MPLPLPVLQERFENSVSNDSDIVYMGYSGSIAKGTYDKYSDLDIEVWLTDSAFWAGETRWQQILEYLGEVQLNYSDNFLDRGFVGSDWLRVDLNVHQISELRPNPQIMSPKMLPNYNEIKRHTGNKPPNPITSFEQRSRVDICNAFDSQIRIASLNARGGQTADVLATLEGCRTTLYDRLMQLSNAGLSDSARELVQATELTSLTKAEFRRASSALWNWTIYVWSQTEHYLGKSLQITPDTGQFLLAVDARYLW